MTTVLIAVVAAIVDQDDDEFGWVILGEQRTQCRGHMGGLVARRGPVGCIIEGAAAGPGEDVVPEHRPPVADRRWPPGARAGPHCRLTPAQRKAVMGRMLDHLRG